MPIANYTTDVPVSRTIGHVSGMLVEHNARSFTTIFEDGEHVGVEFGIETEYGPMHYRMPVRIDAVHLALNRDSQVPPRYRERKHAARVAWRIAHDWLRAQLALIDAGMATLPEVMFPYAVTSNGQTAFAAFERKQLER